VFCSDNVCLIPDRANALLLTIITFMLRIRPQFTYRFDRVISIQINEFLRTFEFLM
jgi:hypothetical protein